jgi:ArsR family transcriptional regulator, arsenate/arsenite/antimonite-responsive transcriptional repressor
MERPLSIAKALADGGRMRIIAALLTQEELCVCQVIEMLQLSAPTVSRHISVLQNAHLVQGRKDGRWVFYRLVDPFPEALRSWLLDSLADSPEIASDRTRLEAILTCPPEEICRRQKEKTGPAAVGCALNEQKSPFPKNKPDNGGKPR